MRIGPDGFFHLTYCTNIHPGEQWDEVFRNLQVHASELKARLAPERPFGIGLRLSDAASRELLVGDELPRFKGWLEENGLYVFTMNGFPYGGFHRQRVKDQVYAPDWRTTERLEYTLRLAQILAVLLPDEMEEGGISTSPISYKPWLSAAEQKEAFEIGAMKLAELTAGLCNLRDETDKLIHVDIEPEPDCLLEDLDETAHFFEDWLIQEGANAGICDDILDHVRVCYDTCHFAVEYERPSDVLERFDEAGIKVGKVQISSALRVQLPDGTEERAALARTLEPFAESTYLHQTVEYAPGRPLRRYTDLPAALSNLFATDGEEWRIHYHVPIFAERFAGLDSTQPDIVDTLSTVLSERSCDHLEIETYTWDVLPPELRLGATDSIEREYEWVLGLVKEGVRPGLVSR